MATGLREERSPATWYNIKRGELLRSQNGEVLEVIGWVSGRITGIRTVYNEKFKHYELHIRMFDATDGPDGRTYILSGSLTNTSQSGESTLQIWPRMLLARLTNEENNIKADDRLRLEFYPWETDYGNASCVAVRFESDPTNLPGPKIDKDDFQTVIAMLEKLQAKYPWGGQQPALQQADIAGELPPAEEAEVETGEAVEKELTPHPFEKIASPKKTVSAEAEADAQVEDDLPF